MQLIRLTLYIAGRTPRSDRAISNLRRLVSEEIEAEHEVVIIDVTENPDAAESARILTTPTLVKESPAPSRRVTGDLSDSAKVILNLALETGPRNNTNSDTTSW